MIRFDAVAARYPGAAQRAVDEVSFEARRSTLTAVVGPNGSGKSTLVRALIGRVGVESGRIAVDDRHIGDIGRDEMARRVAIVAQREELTFPSTVAEYVAIGRYPHLGLWHAPGARDGEVIDDAMRVAGIIPLRHRRVDALSGGEWQRVRLARALAQGGDAVVLDEPTTFLDIAHQYEVLELCSRLHAEGRTLVAVLHDLNQAARYATNLVVMKEGRIVAEGDPRRVLTAALVEEVFGLPCVIIRDPEAGTPLVVPKVPA